MNRILQPRYFTRPEDRQPVHIRAIDDLRLEVLARYPFLTRPWIAALTKSWQGNKKRFQQLRNAAFIKPADAQREHPNYNDLTIYQLDIAGETRLLDRGVLIDKEEFTGPLSHRLMSCKVRASIDLGLSDALKFHTWHDILDSETVPEETLQRDKPHLFHMSFKGEQIKIRPDTYPFVIEHPTDPPTRHFILGIEVDNGTESIRSYDYTRSHIQTKYAHYARFLQDRLYKDILGFPDCLILFTTTSKARMETMMRLWREMTAEHDHLHDKLAFKIFKDEPTGWALTDPWFFADGEELHLNQT